MIVPFAQFSKKKKQEEGRRMKKKKRKKVIGPMEFLTLYCDR